MAKQITLEEALKLVSFEQDEEGYWRVFDVNVNGYVYGNLRSSVGGKLNGSVIGGLLSDGRQLMTDKVTTSDLLEFIAKAQKVSLGVNVKEKDSGYSVDVYCAWLGDNNFYTQSAFISDKGESVEFYEFSAEIDYQVKLKAEKEIEHQKRQEVLSRLSDEDKELLGVS